MNDYILENLGCSIDEGNKENIYDKINRMMQLHMVTLEDIEDYIRAELINLETENIINSKLVDQIEKKLIARDKGKKNDFSSKRNSNIVSSSDKKESSNVLSIFHDTIKSSLDNEFFKREEKGSIAFTYNEDLHNQVVNRLKGNHYSKDMTIVNNYTYFSDFLNCPVSAQVSALKKHYNYLMQFFESFLKKKENFEKFEDITFLPNKKIFSFVRILCDGDGKLNEKSVLVDFPELSYKIYLDISEIENVILFPSQCVAVEGTYVEEGFEKKKLIAEKIYTEFYEKNDYEAENTLERKRANKINVENNTMIMCAAGPFTNKDSLTYAPLYELLIQVKKNKPDFLFLYGPFIDKNNDIFKSGIIEIKGEYLSYEALFERLLINISQELMNQDNLKIYIIPSTEDMINLFPIPQEPYSTPNLKKISKNLNFLSNPSELEFDDDIRFQLFNSSIIDDLRAQTLFKIPMSQNRIDPCLSGLINQKSLAPLYPMSNDVDLRKYQMLRIQENPHFLIIPSNIGNGFAKLIGETVFVNPGFICKNETSGTYAQIVIYHDSSILAHNRTRVDIIQL